MAKLLPHATAGSIRTFRPGLVDRKLSPSRRMVRIGLMRFHQVCGVCVYCCGARSVNVNRPPKKRVGWGDCIRERARRAHWTFHLARTPLQFCQWSRPLWGVVVVRFAKLLFRIRFLRERCFRFDKRRKEAISTRTIQCSRFDSAASVPIECIAVVSEVLRHSACMCITVLSLRRPISLRRMQRPHRTCRDSQRCSKIVSNFRESPHRKRQFRWGKRCGCEEELFTFCCPGAKRLSVGISGEGLFNLSECSLECCKTCAVWRRLCWPFVYILCFSTLPTSLAPLLFSITSGSDLIKCANTKSGTELTRA